VSTFSGEDQARGKAGTLQAHAAMKELRWGWAVQGRKWGYRFSANKWAEKMIERPARALQSRQERAQAKAKEKA
jgi:hypothetical protein